MLNCNMFTRSWFTSHIEVLVTVVYHFETFRSVTAILMNWVANIFITMTPFFRGPTLYHKFENMVLFRPCNLYSIWSPGKQDYHKIIHLYIKKDRNFFRAYVVGFLGYKVNISFLTEKLPYCQIYGTKLGTSYKQRRQYYWVGFCYVRYNLYHIIIL